MMASTPGPAAGALDTSFYDDSAEDVSQGQQPTSSSIRPGTGKTGGPADSSNSFFFNDERRPSLASVATASSSGSKHSVVRNGVHTYKKLQGFFGEESPGKEDPDHAVQGKEQQERKTSATSSFNRKDRQQSDSTARENSPAPSRPRSPVPSSDVVPFLYQDSQVSKSTFHDTSYILE